VLAGTAPLAAANWSAPSPSSIDPGNTVQELVCPTSSLCIAADDNGNVLTSTTPPFSASTWSTAAVDPFRFITGLACSLNVFCLIGDDAGNALAGIPTLPLNTAAPTITGTAIAQQTLTGAHGAWTSNPIDYADQWDDCDTAGNSCTPIAGATGLSYALKPSDVGHTIRLVETASNAAGAGQPANSAPTALVTTTGGAGSPAPSCTLRAKSANVLLPPATKATHKGKPKRRPGTLVFVAHCNQAAHVTLQGKLTEVLKPKHGKKRNKKLSLPKARGFARAGVPMTLTINLPRSALIALKAGTQESVTVTLTATNANGTSVTTDTIRRLKSIAI
jgi:hypothetical protein